MLVLSFALLAGCAESVLMPGIEPQEAAIGAGLPQDGSVNIDFGHAEDGMIVASYFDAGALAVTIETKRGSAVDKSNFDEDVAVPDYLVYLRMTLPSEQVVYEAMQADLPLMSGGEIEADPFGERDGAYTDGLTPVDFDLLSAASWAFADELDAGQFASERLVLEDGAAAMLEDIPEESATNDGSPPPPPYTCSGSACENLDPVTYGCDSTAITAAVVRISWTWGTYLDLRYSSGCETNWGRWSSRLRNSTTVYVDRWSPAQTYSYTRNGTLNYTNMVHCPDLTCLARARVLESGTTYRTGYY